MAGQVQKWPPCLADWTALPQLAFHAVVGCSLLVSAKKTAEDKK